MNFYFCEKCGKRVTEDDLNAGVAIDKKLRGVYCTDCGIGITTQEMEPISASQARDLVQGESTPDVPEASPGTTRRRRRRTTSQNARISRSKIVPATRRSQQSSAVMPAVRRASGVREVPSAPGTAIAPSHGSSRIARVSLDSSSTRNTKLAMGILVGLLVALGAGLMFRGGRTPTQTRPASYRVASPTPPPAPSSSHAPLREPTVEKKPEPADKPGPREIPETPAVTDPPVAPEDSPETRASAAYEALLRFEGLADDDRAGRARRIKDFLALHGETMIAAQARVLLEKLEKEQAPPSTPGPGDVQAATGVASGGVRRKGLVLHLKLDETAGTRAADASGKGCHGTLTGAPAWTVGRIGGALRFDGRDDRVVVENVGVNTAPGAKNTVTFWMRWNGTNSQMPLAWTSSYDLYLNDGRFGFNTGQGEILGHSSAGLANRWVHVAAIFHNGHTSPSNCLLYFDGKKVPLTLSGRPPASKSVASRLIISGVQGSKLYMFAGLLDDLRVYDRALEAAEIQALARGKEPGPDPKVILNERRLKALKAARTAWRSDGPTALEKQARSLTNPEGPGDQPLAGLVRDALAFRGLATAHLKSFEGRDRVKLTFRKGGERLGKVTKVDGDAFEWQTATNSTRHRLADLSLRMRIEWVKGRLKDASRLPVLAAAAALLDAGPKEAQAVLIHAGEKAETWKPFVDVVKAIERQDKNERAWAEIEELAAGKSFRELIQKAEAFRKKPAGEPLTPALNKRVASALAAARDALRAEQRKNLDLKAPIRDLPGGKLELTYDFRDTLQLLDFGKRSSPKAHLSGGELRLAGIDVRHRVPFEGDLSVSYEIAAPGPSPNRIRLHFHDYRGEFGGSGNKWTAIWRTGQTSNEALARKDGVRIKRGTWHRVKIDYTARDKRTRVEIDGRQVLSFTDSKARGRGYVYLGAPAAVKIRSLCIRGKPSFKLIEDAKRRRERLDAFKKKLTSGRLVKIFNKGDKSFWKLAGGAKWRLSGDTATGSGQISLHTFYTTNYELKIEMRLVSGRAAKLYLRSMHGMTYQVVIYPTEVQGYRYHVEESKKKTLKKIATDGHKFHRLHVLSRGNLLRVVMDNKHVLMDLREVPLSCRGFAISTYEGVAAFRRAEGRFPR